MLLILIRNKPAMTEELSPVATSDYAVHSDFLIHWTGKDIDQFYQPNWYADHSSKTNDAAENAYRKRLADILQFGLWMTSEPGFEIAGGVALRRQSAASPN